MGETMGETIAFQESHERFVGDHEQLLLQPVPKAWHMARWDGTHGTCARCASAPAAPARQTAWLMGPLEALTE